MKLHPSVRAQTAIAVAIASIVLAQACTGGRGDQESRAPAASPVATATPAVVATLVPTASPVATATPAAVATPVPTASPVATATPAAVATPISTATPVAARPAGTTDPTSTPGAEATRRGREGLAPWVYHFPPSNAEVTEIQEYWETINGWPEAVRWQARLPSIDAPGGWQHATYRHSTIETDRISQADRPFILVNGERVSVLPPSVDYHNFFLLVLRHREVLAATWWAGTSGSFAPLEGLLVEPVASHVRDYYAGRSGNPVFPYVHEIGAIAHYPASGQAVVYGVTRNGGLVPRDATTGERLATVAPGQAVEWDVAAPGQSSDWYPVGFSLDWWRMERGQWVLFGSASSVFGELSPEHDSFVLEYHEILDPYHQLWLDALRHDHARLRALQE